MVLCVTDDENEDFENYLDPGDDNIAVFVESKKGKTILQYEGYRFRKAYKTRNGTRWNCSSKKSCTGFVYLNDNDEIIMASKYHDHAKPILKAPYLSDSSEQEKFGKLCTLP